MNRSGNSLRVAVIGLGVGLSHVKSFNNSGFAQVTVICDQNQERLNAAKQIAPFARIASNWRSAVIQDDVDIVVVATPDYFHAEMIIASLEAGKHVFAEKPICTQQLELDGINQALQKRPDLSFSANLVLRSNPVFRELRERIRNNELGTISHLECDYLYGRFGNITRGWRGQPPKYSAILGGGIHSIDLLLWLVNELPLSVFGLQSSRSSAALGLPIDDYEIGLLAFPDGLIGKTSATLASAVPHGHSLSVHGTEKTFVYNHFGYSYLEISSPEKNLFQKYQQHYDRGVVATSFLNSILGISEPIVTKIEAINSMTVALAIRQAIDSKSAVKIRYL